MMMQSGRNLGGDSISSWLDSPWIDILRIWFEFGVVTPDGPKTRRDKSQKLPIEICLDLKLMLAASQPHTELELSIQAYKLGGPR